MKIMNKQGDERILSMYWFILFVIVAIAIVSAVYLFYSHPIDVREAEAGILADRVIGCIVQNGVLNSGKLDEISKSTIENSCKLILKDESIGKYKDMKSQYYIQLEAKGKLIQEGDSDFLAFCKEKSKINIPVCVDRELFALDENKEFTIIKIKTIVRKVEQNAKG